MVNFKSLKTESKRIILRGGRNSQNRVLTVSVLFVVVTFFLRMLMSRLCGYTQYATDLYSAMYNGRDIAAVPFPEVSTVAWVLTALVGLMIMMLGLGIEGYYLSASRGVRVKVIDVFNVFERPIRAILLQVVRGVVISICPAIAAVLWTVIATLGMITIPVVCILTACTVLLIAAGVFLFYRYRMAVFVMFDRPDLGATGCLRESARIMKGKKWELFKLDLSFIGWILVGELASFLVAPFLDVWILPYRELTYAQYYDTLIGRPYVPTQEEAPEPQ